MWFIGPFGSLKEYYMAAEKGAKEAHLLNSSEKTFVWNWLKKWLNRDETFDVIEGMTPIAKIEIAIPIPILIINWDRYRDPDLNFKKISRSDRNRSFAIAQSFGRSLFFQYKNAIGKFDGKT